MRKLKVLIVTPYYPFPEYNGGIRKIISSIIKFKPDNIDLSLLSLYDKKDKYFFPKEKEFPHIKFYKIPSKISFSKRKKLSWFLSPLPFVCITVKDSWKDLALFLKQNGSNFDIIHIETPFLAPIVDFLDKNLYSKLIIFPHDSLSMYRERRYKTGKNFIKRQIFKYEYIKAKRLEGKYYPKYRKVVFVSNIDSNYVKKINPKINSEFIPLGIDTDFFSNKNKSFEEKSIVFVGTMAYEPNKQAALFLIEKVAPEISKIYPDFKLYIVGLGSEIFKSFENKNIIVTGFVDDIREFVSKSRLYVSPLPFGTGIKNKVLEAMAMEKVVIGTPVSFEGIPNIENDKNAVIIHTLDTKKWVDTIVDYLNKDSNELNAIGKNARNIINNFSWKKIIEDYSKLYFRILEEKNE